MFNNFIADLLASNVSQRRVARLLSINRKTVVRKFLFMANIAKKSFKDLNLQLPKAQVIEFDDLETFEHSKLKPLSITLAVEHKSRRILGFTVSRMPAKGLLSKKAVKKYGYRKDERSNGRKSLFSDLKELIEPNALMRSDQSPHYPRDLKLFFPKAVHSTYKGRRSSLIGQGEIKKIGFDPLFSLNHTCAMLRANVNRLARKTWSTTKKPERLNLHLFLYAYYHNHYLI